MNVAAGPSFHWRRPDPWVPVDYVLDSAFGADSSRIRAKAIGRNAWGGQR
jgi:hypothetical protein